MSAKDTEAELDQILKQHWFDYIDAEHKVKGNNSNRLMHADEEAKAALLAWRDRCVAEAERLARIDELAQVDQGYRWKSILTYSGFKKWRANRLAKLAPTEPKHE